MLVKEVCYLRLVALGLLPHLFLKMQVGGDWSYLYFLIPSLASFLLSSSVIYKVTLNKQNLRKKFHQLTLLIALFDFIQCFSWFLGPRYEVETKLCQGQEYLFQIGSLGQGIISVIICTTISQAIQFGKVPTWKHKGIIAWVLLLPVCIIFSISFNTATMFCPFNKHHELYHPNISRSAPILPHLISYILSYLFPLLLCVLFTLWHTVRSMYIAYRKSDKAIFHVARQLRLYPAMLVLCMSPIVSYFITIIVTGKDYHPLLFIGAILASSSGMINGAVYFTIIRNSKERTYSTHHFHEQITSSFLMTESTRKIAKKKSRDKEGVSKKRNSPGVVAGETENDDSEDQESSFGYYDDSERGSSAISEQGRVSYHEEISECGDSTISEMFRKGGQ